jgi:hypothetical protein
MRKRTWVITEELTHDDLEWVLRSKLDFEPEQQHYIEIAVYGSNTLKNVPTSREPAQIITTNEKEETWLKLYFADRLILADKYYYDERFYN